ncbi:MAG: SDR family oxidoreductase [Phycisphaerales bacterium]|jgi:NAD(P)-dependent dehydrogenase (short-subunit alcohol dehydrogenase family)|nr:SDR family oxidoreductase [Phycisphaerales bacterium]MBT7171098.1 SDR family oxidoreductase [Phycisphaerales bacterium]
MNSLNNKVIIVTGASSGIGYETAKLLLDRGATVILTSRNIDSVKPDFEQYPNAVFISGDVCDEASVVSLVETVYSKYKQINGLVNCAGFVDPKGVYETSVELFRKTVDVNLTGCFLCTKEVARYMKRTGGTIVNIASTAGLTPRPGWAAYAASKAAVVNFTLTMAEELRSDDITSYCLCPGRTATALRRKLAPNEDPTTIMQPQAVSEIISFCFSEQAKVIEGQIIEVRDRV